MYTQVQTTQPVYYVSTSFDTLYTTPPEKIFLASVKNTVVSVQQVVNPSQNTNSPTYEDFLYRNFVQSNNTNPQVDYLLTENY